MHKVYTKSTQQENVVKGAMATCIFGVTPAMMNSIVDNMFVSFNGKLTATTMSIGPCFPPPGFGICSVVPNLPKPCACQITKWDLPDNFVTVNKIAHPLTKLSRGSCALSPVPMCISFLMPGQIPFPGIPGVVAPIVAQSDLTPIAVTNGLPLIVCKLINIKVFNQDWELVNTVPSDGYVTLVSDTIAHEIGDEVTFEVEGVGSFTGHVEADSKAYARYCYLGSDWNGQDYTSNPPKQEPKDKIADALLSDQNAVDQIHLNSVGRNAWDKPDDGFESDLNSGKVDLKGMEKEEFLDNYKRTSEGVANIEDEDTEHECRSIDGLSPSAYGKPLSQEEHKKILDIRKGIYDKQELNENTVFQKVVCCDRNLREWLSTANEYGRNGGLKVVGSTLLAKDGKHLKTPADLYDGLQLNYGTPSGNPYYPPPPRCMYVMRYTTKQPQNAKIPVHDINDVPDNPKGNRDAFTQVPGNTYPFTGNGFTPATGTGADGKARVGTPEVFVPYGSPQEVDRAIIVRIDADGTETIVGYKTMIKQKDGSYAPQFVCVDEAGNPVEEFSDSEKEANKNAKKAKAQKERENKIVAAGI